MNEDQFDFNVDQEEYAKLLVRLADGSTIKGTVKSTRRLPDEVNSSERFLVLDDAVCKFADGRVVRRKIFFVNKEHVVWAVPA